MSVRDEQPEGIRARGEEALGDIANALLENPLLNQAVSAAFRAGERAQQAQRSALDALNLPSSSQVERLERRLRSLSQRLEEVEEELDGVKRQERAAAKKPASRKKPAKKQ